MKEAFAQAVFFEKMENELKPEDFLSLLKQLSLKEYVRGEVVFKDGRTSRIYCRGLWDS